MGLTPFLQEVMALALVLVCAAYLCVRRIRRRRQHCCEGQGCGALRSASARGSSDNRPDM